MTKIKDDTFINKLYQDIESTNKSILIKKGFTTYELLLCMAILVLVLMSSISGLTDLIQGITGERTIYQFARAINLARHTALEYGATVTLCRSNDGLSCSGDWENGSIVFIDHNSNRMVDQEDRIIFHFSDIKNGTIRFRSFQNRQSLQFTSLGFTNSQNGTFTWCPNDGNSHHAQQLIINHSGRVRIATDLDKDGLKEDSQGRPLVC
jgi:type IV fimbrial biogenesis protein FimT